MMGKTAISDAKPPSTPPLTAGGDLCPPASPSEFPWTPRMATLMVGAGGHPGNVGIHAFHENSSRNAARHQSIGGAAGVLRDIGAESIVPPWRASPGAPKGG